VSLNFAKVSLSKWSLSKWFHNSDIQMISICYLIDPIK
jgi:hypothetical protein